MANYTFGKDIVEDVLFRASEHETDSDYLTQAQQYVNRAYYSFLCYADWPFAKKYPPGIINFPGEETGTASVTNGNTAITLATTIVADMVNRKIYFDNDQIIYRITAHGGGTAITIDAAFTEDTKTSANYTIFKDEFDLASDCMVPLRFWYRNDPERLITDINANEMFNKVAKNSLWPGHWAYINDSKVRFDYWTEDTSTIEYDYIYAPGFLDFAGTGDDDTPVVPLQHRPIISDWALGFLLEDKDDSKSITAWRSLKRDIGLIERQYAKLRKPKFRPSPGNRIAP